MLEVLTQELHKCGLSLNTSKTKIFTNTCRDDGVPTFIDTGSDMLPVTDSNDMHKYLGRKFSGDLLKRSEANLDYRLECAWGKFHCNKTVLTNPEISLRLRLRLFDAVVTPTALYGLASTALTALQRSRIASVRRRMLSKIVRWRKQTHSNNRHV